jgi:hypothetical protein
MVRRGLLLSCDLAVSKERINLSGDIPIAFGARYTVQYGRNQVTPGLTPARGQSIDALQHGLGQRDRDFLHRHRSFSSNRRFGILACSYHNDVPRSNKPDGIDFGTVNFA